MITILPFFYSCYTACPYLIAHYYVGPYFFLSILPLIVWLLTILSVRLWFLSLFFEFINFLYFLILMLTIQLGQLVLLKHFLLKLLVCMVFPPPYCTIWKNHIIFNLINICYTKKQCGDFVMYHNTLYYVLIYCILLYCLQ